MTTTTPTADDIVPATTLRRVVWRLVPLLLACYVISYLDRINVGFAALTANRDLGFSPTTYATGASIFFVGYFLFEIPSNLALERFGARLWIARIMITWGLIAAAMALVTGKWSFYSVRFLLGAAEAGFFPGIILYLSYWFPAERRARAIGVFIIGIPLASFLGSPISGALLGLDGVLGIKGWQWLYIVEAAPSVLLGFTLLWLLPDKPADARFLTPDERAWLQGEIDAERARTGGARTPQFRWAMLAAPRTLLLALIFLANGAASYGISFWLPQIVKRYGGSNLATGFVSAIPPGIACVATILWGMRSDRRGERVWHTLLPGLLSAVGLAGSVMSDDPLPQIASLSLALCGIYAFKGPFWALVTEAFAPGEKAAGIAIVSSIGNLGGVLGPYIMGVGVDVTGGFSLGLIALAVFAGIGALLVMAPSIRRAARV